VTSGKNYGGCTCGRAWVGIEKAVRKNGDGGGGKLELVGS